MTCKDCIQYEVCKSFADRGLITLLSGLDGAEENKCFKDKSRFIELPCKVGAEIFILMIDDEFPNYVDLGTVEGLSYQADGVWIFARYECGLTYWHPLKELGKEFFFDPYEAEKALKERESNA